MLHSLIIIAKAEVVTADKPPTNGEGIAGLLTLLAIVLSCVTVVRCFLRWQGGQVVMPVAKREPLHVPIPLAILGVVVATILASAATLASLDDFIAEQTDSTEVSQDEESSIDEATGAPTDVDKADNETSDGDGPETSEQSVRTMALRVIEGTVGMNAVLLLLFGIAVWLVQADGPERAFKENSSTADDNPEDLLNETADRITDQQLPVNDFAAADFATTGPVIAAVQEPWNLFVELKFASLAFLMALVPTFAARLIMLAFMEQPKSHQFITMIQSGALSTQLLMLLLLIATIVAPVVEELLYRVVVLGGLRNRRAPWVAVAVSSVLFGFAHGFPDCISLLPLAFVLGYTYIQRRSYRTVMLVHLIFNSFNMVLLLIQLFVSD